MCLLVCCDLTYLLGLQAWCWPALGDVWIVDPGPCREVWVGPGDECRQAPLGATLPNCCALQLICGYPVVVAWCEALRRRGFVLAADSSFSNVVTSSGLVIERRLLARHILTCPGVVLADAADASGTPSPSVPAATSTCKGRREGVSVLGAPVASQGCIV